MPKVNNESVQEFVQDLRRGSTFFRFEHLDEKTNNQIGMFIIHISRAIGVDGVRIDDAESASHQNLNGGPSSKKNDNDDPLADLEPLNRLLVLVINYFWDYSQKKGSNPNEKMDKKILLAMSKAKTIVAERRDIDQKSERIDENPPVNEKGKHEAVLDWKAEMQQSLSRFYQLLGEKFSLSLAPELISFFNQYEQALVNPFKPGIIKHFPIFRSSFDLKHARNRTKTFFFFTSIRQIIVKNICSSITLLIVHQDLDGIKINFEPMTLTFSSQATLDLAINESKIEETEEDVTKHEIVKPVFIYTYTGDYSELFEKCEGSESHTAQFLLQSLTQYRDKTQVFTNYSKETVERIITEQISFLRQASARVNNSLVVGQQEETTPSILPYLIPPATGTLFLIMLGTAGVIVFSPAAGFIILITGAAGAILGGAGGIVTSELQEWLTERHNNDVAILPHMAGQSTFQAVNSSSEEHTPLNSREQDYGSVHKPNNNGL